MYEPVESNPRKKVIILLVVVLCILLALLFRLIDPAPPQRQPPPPPADNWEDRFLQRLTCDRERAEWTRIFNSTQPSENQLRGLYAARFRQPQQPNASRTVVSIENVRNDFEYMMAMLRNNFPYRDFAYRHLGVDIDVLEAQFLESIDNITTSTGNIHYTSFLRMIQEEFMRPLRSTGHIWALPLSHFDSPARIIPVDDRMSFESIEPGKIAYMNIRSFSALYDQVELIHEITDVFADFYASITDYEHLIIDIRHNRGGNPSFFFDVMILPLMPEDHLHIDFYFATSLRAATDGFNRTGFTRSGARGLFTIQSARDIIPMGQLLELYGHELLHLHPNDRDAFNYGFRNVHEFKVPRTICKNGYETIEPVFNGKIWLLIDGGYSATVYIANRVQDIGLATLVGNTTGGATGSGRLSHRLPNSGIVIRYDALHVTDRHGRSLEYGIDPHIFCDDPLTTVLQLIQSGEYRYLGFTSK